MSAISFRAAGATADTGALRELSLAWLTVGETDPLTLIRAAAESGFGRVGLKVVPNPGSGARALAGDAAMIRQIRRALADCGISVLEMGGVWFGADLDPRTLAPSLQAGAEIGARYVIAAVADPDPARLASNLAAACEIAAPLGISVALEPIAYSPLATLARAHEVAAATGFTSCGIVADALHLARAGTPFAEIARLPRDRLLLAHLCDAPRSAPADLRVESRSARLAPGDGELDLFAFLNALPPGVPIEVEAPCAALSGLPPVERAMNVAGTTLRFLERWRSTRPEARWNAG